MSSENADPHDAPPEIQSRRLRQMLFIPELERLLGDPVDFPLTDDLIDPIRVRMDQAIDTVERRAQELSGIANGQVQTFRVSIALSCFVGIAATIIALTLAEYRLPAVVVMVLEVGVVLWFSGAMRRHAVDAVELLRLAGRYRPALDAATEAKPLRALAERIAREMNEIWIAPEKSEET